MTNLIEKTLTGESIQLNALSNNSQITLDKLGMTNLFEKTLTGTTYRRISNNNLSENRDATDILEIEQLCDESFSEIIKEEEEEEVIEEDENAIETVTDANKLRRVHEAEQGQKEHDDGQNGNQESEQG
ncbi:hypothetical protein HAX54_043760 [Datura stramonium]|uniref:Uncharacterized protein n=1 Tax=Datura stramonium TaxID=4076 RepID=A0ABS8SPZ2_DATST|nr:hypothetical protein [Datura stramonium]